VKRAAIALAAALALAGCGALGPSGPGGPGGLAGGPSGRGGPGGASHPSKVAVAQRTHEYPATSTARQAAVGGAPGAEQAVRQFATAYVNWTASTVARDMLALAAESIGQARSATELAASETASDYELRRGGVANSGTVEAVTALAHGRDRFVVVTLERTTATATDAYQGLAPAWHVTVATASELGPGRWVVSGWQPEG
jgi:hypothetical protein